MEDSKVQVPRDGEEKRPSQRKNKLFLFLRIEKKNLRVVIAARGELENFLRKRPPLPTDCYKKLLAKIFVKKITPPSYGKSGQLTRGTYRHWQS
jgi:hypothetical protein